MVIRTRNDAILRDLEPFLVATPFNLPFLDRSPFGMSIPDENVIDPLRVESERFLLLLQRLDQATFGPEGMPMPRWVFFDCSELPGAIFGYARRAEDLSEHARAVYDVPADYRGLVPYSMYIAIPMHPRGCWFGHNLASIAPTLPEEDLKGLGSITKAIALKVFRSRTLYGATQWDSSALFIHTRFGPIELMTAWTPAHSEAETVTYFLPIDDLRIRAAAGDPTAVIERPAPDLTVGAEDRELMLELQDALERGERLIIPGPPVPDPQRPGAFRVPVHRVR
ncbi:MAG: hypothetical protein AMXMBFR64_34610 [Myxococcales bacterium]